MIALPSPMQTSYKQRPPLRTDATKRRMIHFFLSRCSIGEIIGGERLQKRAWIKSPHHKGTLSMLRHRKLNSHVMFWGQNEVFAAVSSLIQMNAIIYGKTGGYSRRGSGPCSTLALGIKLALAE